MDNRRFDALTRSVSSGVSRRAMLRMLASGLAASAGLRTGLVGEAKRCKSGGEHCGRGRGGTMQCCSESCCDGLCCDEGTACVGAECCPLVQACFDICCPPENIGCVAPHELPDGSLTSASCLCPEGADYRDGQCAPCLGSGFCCGGEATCCPGTTCCGGICISDDFAYCCAGNPCANQCDCIEEQCTGSSSACILFPPMCITPVPTV